MRVDVEYPHNKLAFEAVSVTSSDEHREHKASIERFWNRSSVVVLDSVEELLKHKTNMFRDILEEPEAPQNMFVLPCVATKRRVFKDSFSFI
jgi:hypothetical protein